MIISDLQYIETVENSEVQGGWGFSFADSKADAIAVGDFSVALTKTFSAAVPGGAQASSRSLAISSSGKKKGGKKKGGNGDDHDSD
jgi:hypothetical protein